MRVTSGNFKGRRLRHPRAIRPTQEKVRQALFDILGDIEGLSFLELYAGSGAVGFEAVSRGVKELTLVEYNYDCQLAIKKNIETLGLTHCNLYPLEVLKTIKSLSRDGKKFDLIFLDPPYSGGVTSGVGKVEPDASLAKKTLQELSRYDILTPEGFIIVQHFKKENLPEKLGVLNLFKQNRYGDSILSFYKKSL